MRKLMAAVAAALLCLTLAATTALADVDVYTQGTVGQHSLRNDTPEMGGVVCTYDSSGHLVKARMRPPIVYAVDTNGQRNSGLVGWRLIVDHYTPTQSGSAEIFYRSGTQKRIAYDDAPARFSGVTVTKPFPASDEFRFFARMIWYRADGSVKGASVHVATQYRRVSPWSIEVVYGACQGSLT